MSKTAAKHESDPLVQDAIKYGGWSVVADTKGKKYYQNKKLKKSTWDLKKDIEAGTYPKYALDNGAGTPAADKVQEAMNEHHGTGATVLGSHGVVPTTGTGGFMSAGQDKRISGLMQANTNLQNEIESLKLEQDAIAMAISEANQKVQDLSNSSKDKDSLTAKVVPSFSADGNEKLLAQANETRMENWHIFSQLSELVTLLGQGLQETAASRAEVGATLTNETRALQMPEGVAETGEEAKNDEAEKTEEKEEEKEKETYGSELKGEAGAAVINRFLDTAGKYQISPNSLSGLLKYRDIDLLGKEKAENPFGSASSTVSNPYPAGEGATGALERAIAASKQKQQLGAAGPSYIGGSPNIGKATPWGVAQGNHAADGYRPDSPTAAPFY